MLKCCFTGCFNEALIGARYPSGDKFYYCAKHMDYAHKVRKNMCSTVFKIFTPGDTIVWMGDQFKVIENFGDYGTVTPVGRNTVEIKGFYWDGFGKNHSY